MSFAHLFTPHKIRGLELRNRIFSSSHQTLLARDWCPNEEMAAYHEARAAGNLFGTRVLVRKSDCPT